MATVKGIKENQLDVVFTNKVATAQTTASGAVTAASNAQTTANGAATAASNAATAASGAATAATNAQNTANAKVGGFHRIETIVNEEDTAVGTTGLTMETGVTTLANIADVQLYENGVANESATVVTSSDLRLVGGVSVTVVVFTITGLNNPVEAGDAFRLRLSLYAPISPN